jgi:hypothetical protein
VARKQKETPDYRPNERDRDAIEEVRECISYAKKWHNAFARRVERRYDAWRGLQDTDTKPKGWRSNQHPPYLINIVEGMLSSLEDPNPAWTITPRVYPGVTVEEIVQRTEGADIGSYLLGHQMRIDGFDEKAGPYAHQDLIAGLTVGKIHWLKQDVVRYSREEVPELIHDETGGTIDIANKLQRFEDAVTIRDDPTFEVRDVRDWMYPESAVSIDKSPWIIDRTYITYQTLVRMEELGVYKNTKYVKETRIGDTQADADAVREREKRLRGVDRTAGLVEIVELWTDKKVVTLANKSVLLRNERNPFEHGRKPFVVCSAIPDLFQIPGVSVIEGLAQMQEMLWTLSNLRLDASRIAANVITMIRGDVDNPEQYEWAPEAQWIVPDPNAVKVMDMTGVAAAASATLESEGLLRGDIQNVMGGLPFTGGAESQTIAGSNTATGVSIVTNIAQAILARRKLQYQKAFGKIGQMFLELDQQFLTETRLVEVLGEEGARRYFEADPLDIQGVYDVELEVTGESMMRQERRAENQALVTMATQAAEVMSANGTPLNLRRFWERLLDSYGITDKATYFSETPGAAAGGMGTPPEADEILQQLQNGSMPAGGITNEALAAGPSSPSSPVSMSPAAPMQQSLARSGAGRSV